MSLPCWVKQKNFFWSIFSTLSSSVTFFTVVFFVADRMGSSFCQEFTHQTAGADVLFC